MRKYMGDSFKLERSIEEFLVEKPIDGYDYMLRYFCEFLEYKNITAATTKTFFQGIRSQDLIEAIDHYIETRNVTSIGATNKYSSCLKEYLNYIIHKEYISNNDLMAEFGYRSFNEKSYRYKVNKYIKKNSKINKTQGFEMFDEDTINIVIQECNSWLMDEKILSRASTSSKYFNRLRSAVIIKLIIYTGVWYRVVPTILLADLDIPHGQIKINGFNIHLPNDLADQMLKFKNIRDQIVKRLTDSNKEINGQDFLFIEFSGSTLSVKTAITASALREIIETNQLTGIVKYSITNMIKKGINQSLIMKLTDAGNKVYNWCQEEVNKNMDMIESSRYIDSKLRSMNIFDLL